MVRIGMETVAARLTTFDTANQPNPRGRPSNTRPKPIAWPYLRPSPIDLAQAGFYHSPTAVSPDNTACFLCERALDGWEEDDDPITEHLRHSSDCGWAIMMTVSRESSNPNEIDDPNSPRIAEARKATFYSWPHDGKRGWVCKTEKMVEAGWYFCPNEESPDFATCPYCSLSLDGWEPKDDPYDEHHRRSPDCSFFQYKALSENKPAKSKRGRKPRSSKTSRASTQSTATTRSESVMDLDSDMDQSAVSQSAPKAPKTAKKRGRKPKKQEPMETSSQMDVGSQNGDAEIQDPPRNTKTRGRKRKSEEISHAAEGQQDDDDDPFQQEHPPKRQTTRSRSKAPANNQTEPSNPKQSHETGKKPSKAGRKKRSTSKSRKAPSNGNTSKASLKSQIPDDAEIDAELEAQLEGDDGDMELDDHDHGAESSRVTGAPQTTGRSRVTDAEDGLEPEEQTKPRGKKASTKKASTTAKSKAIPDSILIISSDPDFDMDNSIVPANLPAKKAQKGGSEMVPSKDASKKTAKTEPLPKGSKNAKQTRKEQDTLSTIDSNEIAGAAPMPPGSDFDMEQQLSHEDDEEQMSDRFNGSQSASMFKSGRNNDVSAIDTNEPNHKNTEHSHLKAHTGSVSSPAAAQECTPSPSPQSSDAENRPPSSMPNIASTSKSQSGRGPYGTSTPIKSPWKGQFQTEQLSTTHSWTPVDLEEVLLGDSDDKENLNLSGILQAAGGDLGASEKGMTVEEWIHWNARNGEEKLKNECERMVSIFEKEGSRAMRALEGIECTE